MQISRIILLRITWNTTSQQLATLASSTCLTLSDLERTKVRVDREDVDQLQGGEDVGGSKESLQSKRVKSVQEETNC